MYRIEPLRAIEMRWGVADENGRPLLFVEPAASPECKVYEYEEHHPSGRGTLVATFVGSHALERACDWITTVQVPRVLHSRRRALESKPEVRRSRMTKTKAYEARSGIEGHLVR